MRDLPCVPGLPSTADSRRAVYAVMLVQSLLASGTHLVAKVVVASVDAFTLTLVRSLIAGLAAGLLLLIRGGRLPVRKQDYGLVFLLAFLAVPVNQFLFLFGMRYTTASNAALLYSTTPILVVLFSRWLLGEPLTGKKITGVILGFIGVVIVIFERGVDASMQYLLGNVILYLAVLAWGLCTVLGKRLIVRYGAFQASSITLIIGTLIFLPLGAVPALRFPYHELGVANWLEILYLGLITSVISYLLLYYALARLEAGRVALFAYLQPVLTTVMAVLLLGQDVTFLFVAGGTVALSGVIVAQSG